MENFLVYICNPTQKVIENMMRPTGTKESKQKLKTPQNRFHVQTAHQTFTEHVIPVFDKLFVELQREESFTVPPMG